MQEVCTEVSEIIKYMPKEYQKKIPKDMIDFFKSQIVKDYEVKIDPNNIFDKTRLKEETLNIIAMLNIKYWCPNQKIRNQLIKKYNENEKQYQKTIREKYNPNDILKKKTRIKMTKKVITNEIAKVEYKESIFKKFINGIKSIFYIK